MHRSRCTLVLAGRYREHLSLLTYFGKLLRAVLRLVEEGVIVVVGLDRHASRRNSYLQMACGLVVTFSNVFGLDLDLGFGAIRERYHQNHSHYLCSDRHTVHRAVYSAVNTGQAYIPAVCQAPLPERTGSAGSALGLVPLSAQGQQLDSCRSAVQIPHLTAMEGSQVVPVGDSVLHRCAHKEHIQ